jgi:ankyrin repeat protein
MKFKKFFLFPIVLILLLGLVGLYYNPTAYAIRYNSPLAKMLIYLRVGINILDDTKWTPLGIAVDKGYNDIAVLLVQRGADVNKECIDDSSYTTARTPLMIACNNGNVSLIKLLIEHGADVNAQSPDHIKNTPLIYAAMAVHFEEPVKILLAHGADVNMKNKRGETALKHALVPPSSLYSDHVYNLQGWNYNIQIETVNALLESGADVNIKDWIGDTALMSAIWANDIELIKTLLNKGADVNAMSKSNDTALMYAVLSKKDSKEIVTLLLDNGANINDKMGFEMFTPLIYATRQPNIEILKLLLERGADVNITSPKNNISALRSATQANQPQMIKMLLDNGANINERDSRGFTALKFASTYGRVDCAKILRQYGGSE